MPSNRVLTIPNLVTFARLAAVPVFWWLLLVQEQVGPAAVLVVVIGATDWIDGYLARRLGQMSRLGAILDPVADRVLIGSAVVAGLIAEVLPAMFAVPLIARELILALVTLFLWLKGAGFLVVRWLGKTATFLLYGAIPAFYAAAAGMSQDIFLTIGWLLGSIGLVLYWLVFFQYLGDARAVLRALESPPTPQES